MGPFAGAASLRGAKMNAVRSTPSIRHDRDLVASRAIPEERHMACFSWETTLHDPLEDERDDRDSQPNRNARQEVVMIEIRRILCPVDFSDYSRRALDHAIAIARWYESTVTALHVFSPVPIAAYGPSPVAFEPIVLTKADRDRLLASTKAFVEAESAPGVPIEAAVREGNTAAEILDQAANMSADLLVIGTHGRSGFERLLLGSVTEKVLRKACCPVLTVPRRLPDAVPPGPVLFKRMLCAVDFSECSMHALKYALSLAQEADGCLTVVHVLAPELVGQVAIGEEHVSLAALQRQHEQEARQLLEQAVPETVGAYCKADSLLRRGKPWREILQVASERQAELIVMGVQGRGAADLMFFGSTTQHIVREATCPVLTLRRE
jgi:nucleotide-binding universal stress UspA family protein